MWKPQAETVCSGGRRRRRVNHCCYALLAIIVLDYDERVWSLRLLWQRRAYLRERKRGRKLGGYSYFGDSDDDD